MAALAPPIDLVRCSDLIALPQNRLYEQHYLRELVTLYLTQTAEQLEQLEAAVRAAAPQEVRRLAHSCAGASATCGMTKLVPLLRDLERKGFDQKLGNSTQLCQQANHEFARIRVFLEAYLASHCELAAEP